MAVEPKTYFVHFGLPTCAAPDIHPHHSFSKSLEVSTEVPAHWFWFGNVSTPLPRGNPVAKYGMYYLRVSVRPPGAEYHVLTVGVCAGCPLHVLGRRANAPRVVYAVIHVARRPNTSCFESMHRYQSVPRYVITRQSKHRGSRKLAYRHVIHCYGSIPRPYRPQTVLQARSAAYSGGSLLPGFWSYHPR
jgi:hypothetical protein